jgi:hypothetical protein
MKFSFFLLFLCLLIPAGRELTAQNRHESLQKTISGSSYNIAAPMMSKEGAWLTLRKKSRSAWEKSDWIKTP